VVSVLAQPIQKLTAGMCTMSAAGSAPGADEAKALGIGVEALGIE